MADKTCDVVGCERPAEKSIGRNRAEKVFKLKPGKGSKVHLCKEHYKEWKKKTKKERKVERLTWV